MSGCKIFFFVLVVLMVQHTVSAPASSSNNDPGNSYEDDLEELKDLLQELMNREKDRNDPKPTTKVTHRPHELVFIDGDIQSISTNDHHQIKEELPTQPGDKRNIKTTTKLWDKGHIKYSFSSSSPITPENQRKVQGMMDKIEISTCIVWEQVPDTTTDYHVTIENGQGCHSRTGDVQSGRSQVISLKEPDCMTSGTILHELAHTIGLEHEQSRKDRDKYIPIDWDNLFGGHQNPNYGMNDALKFHIPFDYYSVMLYSPYSMAKHLGSKTFQTNDPILEQLTLEDHRDLSYYDKLLINRAYDCAGHCDLKNCKHGNFLSKNCKCTCPDGLTGELCGSAKQEGNCQNEDHFVIGSIGETVTVESTGYPNSYPTGSTCRWLVEGPEGCKLRVTILDMDIVSADGHCSHWMELRYNLIAQPGPEFCGDSKGKITSFTSQDSAEANSMVVSFNTTNNVPSRGFRGFKLEFKAVQGNDATKPVNFCENVNCKNGGTCHHNDNSYRCSCVSGFSGRLCEDQNLQSDQTTVFSCDDTNMDECGQIDLGEAWEEKGGYFTVKKGHMGSAHLQIPYISEHDHQYCFHFMISRTGSPQPTTCPRLRFIVTKELELSGFLIEYEEHLLSDDDCKPKTDYIETVSLTSQPKILKMELKIENIKEDSGKIELSHFLLQLGICS